MKTKKTTTNNKSFPTLNHLKSLAKAHTSQHLTKQVLIKIELTSFNKVSTNQILIFHTFLFTDINAEEFNIFNQYSKEEIDTDISKKYFKFSEL